MTSIDLDSQTRLRRNCKIPSWLLCALFLMYGCTSQRGEKFKETAHRLRLHAAVGQSVTFFQPDEISKLDQWFHLAIEQEILTNDDAEYLTYDAWGDKFAFAANSPSGDSVVVVISSKNHHNSQLRIVLTFSKAMDNTFKCTGTKYFWSEG